MKQFGIDVSLFQGKISWEKLVGANPSLSFAILKASQGPSPFSEVSFSDPRFAENVAGASAAGLALGAYHLLTGTTQAAVREEALFFTSLLSRYREKITLPAAVDFEELPGIPSYSDKSREENTLLIRVFCETVREAGFSPCLYTNRDFLTNHLEKAALNDLPLWYARWGVPEKTALAECPDLSFWQFGTQSLPEIGEVDVNYYYPKRKEENDMPRMQTLSQIEENAPYALPTVKKLIEKGYLRGNGSTNEKNEPTGLDLSVDMLRILVINDRAGLFR